MPVPSSTDKIIDKISKIGKDKDKDKHDCFKWFMENINNLKNSSKTKQLVVGSSAGLVTGYATGKFGKMIGYTVGGTILLINVATHAGYIKINWNEMNNDIESAKSKLSKKAEKEIPKFISKAKDFVSENIILASGYVGGFLIGLSSS